MKKIKLLASLAVCIILSLAFVGCGEKMTVEEMDVNVRKKSKIYDWMLYGKDVH